MKQKGKIGTIAFTLSLVTSIAVLSNVHQKKLKLQKGSQEQVWITVFVHGSLTTMLRPPSPSTFFSILKGNIENTLYEKTTNIMRQDPLYATGQAMKDLGLKLVDKNSTQKGNAAAALAQILDKLDLWVNQREPKNNIYYTYGWPGLVSKKVRYQAAKRFGKELGKEVEALKEKGIEPKVRILAYSHGGNVTLNLGRVQQKENMDFGFSVNELVLIGVPLHHGIDYLVKSPIFKKVYNIYSRSDVVQRLDLCARGSFFSRRQFISRKNFKIPKKLTEIKLKMVRNKGTKNWPASDPRVNFSNNRIFSGNSHLLRNSSPGHIELWFFSWVGSDYRKKIPIKPLPAVALLPTIISTIEKNKKNDEQHYVADLRPDQTTLIIKEKNGNSSIHTLPEEKFKELKEIAEKFAIPMVKDKEYRQAKALAIKKAKSTS